MTFGLWLIAFSLLSLTSNLSPLTRCLLPWPSYLLLFSFFRLQAQHQARVALSDGTVSGIAQSFGKSIRQRASLGSRGRD